VRTDAPIEPVVVNVDVVDASARRSVRLWGAADRGENGRCVVTRLLLISKHLGKIRPGSSKGSESVNHAITCRNCAGVSNDNQVQVSHGGEWM
jgi:hypothetical protein